MGDLDDLDDAAIELKRKAIELEEKANADPADPQLSRC